MLDRLVYAIGPGADEIGARAFGVLARGRWSSVYSDSVRFGSVYDYEVLSTLGGNLTALAKACELLDRSEMFHRWKVLAYSSFAPSPYPGWYASARFPVTVLEIDTPLNRFQALEKTAALLSKLGAPNELIEDRIRLSIDE